MSPAPRTIASMSELEWLGWERMAWLALGAGSRGRGVTDLLRVLIQAEGRPLTLDQLIVRLGERRSGELMLPSSMRVCLCWLRECLADCGFEGALPTQPGGAGARGTWAIAPADAERILNFVLSRGRDGGPGTGEAS